MTITITITGASADEALRCMRQLAHADGQEQPAAPPPPQDGQEQPAAPPPPQDGQEQPAAPPPPQDGQELDSEGNPWDSRIHAPSRIRNKDGRWRIKRGVDRDLVDQVTSENRAILAATPPQDQPDAPPPPPPPQDGQDQPDAPPPPPPQDGQEQPAAPPPPQEPQEQPAAPPPPQDSQEQPAAPPPPQEPQEQPAAPPPPAVTWPSILKEVSAHMVAGRVTQEQLDAIAQDFGIPAFCRLNLRQDLLADVKDRIDALIQ
jgi:hypothetical protein